MNNGNNDDIDETETEEDDDCVDEETLITKINGVVSENYYEARSQINHWANVAWKMECLLRELRNSVSNNTLEDNTHAFREEIDRLRSDINLPDFTLENLLDTLDAGYSFDSEYYDSIC